MVIYIPAALIYFYLLIRLILPLAVSKKMKTLLAALLFAASQGHLLKGLFFGGLASPELPPLVLMVQGGLFIFVIFVFLLVLVRDFFLLLRRVFSVRPAPAGENFSVGRRRFLLTGAAAVPAALSAKQALAASLLTTVPAAYGVTRAVAVPDIQPLELPLARLPRELDGLRLIHVSDLHVSPLFTRDWVQGVVDRINEARADLILITGDLVDGLPSRRMESMEPLRGLRSRHGVYACAGNHEYYTDYHSWMEISPELGLTMLLNEHKALSINGRELVLAGLTDPAALRFGLPGPNPAAALAGAPAEAVRIVLDHRPGQAGRNAAAGFDLQLSGHTHGGQLPGMMQLTTLFNDGYLYGLYQVRDMLMYVSSGAGLWNGFPVRLGVPSEIALITLTRKKSD